MPFKFFDSNGETSSTLLADGVIEIEAPRDFLDSDLSGFSLEWVDFYR